MTYREFVNFVKDTIREYGAGFTSPNDDWPMAICVDHSTDATPHWFEPPDEVTARPDGIQILGQALAAGSLITRPTKVAIVTSTWQVIVDRDEPVPPDMPRPGDHPDRFEAVVAIVMDAERVEPWTALIERHPDAPPTLGEWEVGDEAGGALVDPLRAALR